MGLAEAIAASAQRLGIDPVDLATAISYETAGTFDPWKAGPTTKWGQHRGLIQWGEPQRERYGVSQGMPVADQMSAVERYLTDAGVRPGHKLLDVYSAINAGKVGRYNASDSAAGGAPGTVRDKVEQQMTGHREKAALLLDGGPARAAATVMPGPAPALAPLFAGAAPTGAPDLGSLAAAFIQRTQEGRRRSEEAAAADQARRQALFGGGVPSF